MKKKNVLYALGQVFLIFIGVTIAILFENLNQQRKDDNLQFLLLKEMVSNLEDDTLSVSTAIKLMNQQAYSGKRIFEILADPKADHDSLGHYFEMIGWANVGRYNLASYETFKSRGLDLITNDTLRTQISAYYERDINFIKKIEDVSHNLAYGQFVPLLMNKFSNSYSAEARPENIRLLASDNEFKQYVSIALTLKAYEKSRYEVHLRKAKRLIDKIQREIGHK